MQGLSTKKLLIAIFVIIIGISLPTYVVYTERSERMMAQNRTDDEPVELIGFFTTEPVIMEGAVTTEPQPTESTTEPVAETTTSTQPLELPKWKPMFPASDGKMIKDNLVEEDSINVLILGLDREAYLNDTIGVVSISKEKKSVRLIMFPRDTYIGYSEEVIRGIKKIGHASLPGEYKINNVYNIGNHLKTVSDAQYNKGKFKENGFDFLAQVIYEKFDIIVDDYVRINTYGFIRLVDMFGGVKVYVPVRMLYDDPLQNLHINLSKGTQVLNGTQAEGFVRFRESNEGVGNKVYADRTANQVAFLKAFYEQHGKLSNIGKIPELISLLKKNVVHSVGVGDVLTKYMDILKEIVNDNYVFESVAFETELTRINGSSYMVIK